ncbi:peptidylprolyl isomerase [Qipengyuania sp. XHP0211]|uniref:peptidylprolyl isomerase n=1 Tax=Qipengyuania sp. XHP0211 TaxID=3038079 RepID=UPI00241FF698|nr:peptidylprolyl isomerase [Qipengyuania sp. XHP0211]MDG5750695.1 peptidylprolyl isomerase [Qipengyuania sp. XHP0211]
MSANRISKFLSLAAVAGLALSPISVSAQATAETANPLGLPTDVSILGNSDPNVRKATAVVNGFVITGTDVDQRAALLVAANEREISPEELERVKMQVLRNLIDETLQIQAAETQEITIPQAEIDQSYARVAAQNFGQDESAMGEYLRSIGSSPQSLKRQIHGELAWSRLLRRNFAPFVNVSADEVNDLIQRLEANRGTDEYRLGEIFLQATPETAAQVQGNAQQIVEQLRQGGSFVAYARQFSQASTAAVGGDLGWIALPQLKNPQLETVVGEMSPGQLVGPLEIPGGYWIGLLIDKRQVLTADPRDAVLSLKQIALDFTGVPEAERTPRLESFLAGVQQLRGCGDAEAGASALGATVVTNDEIAARALPEQLQQLVLNLQLGQVTPPFGSFEEGVRVLMLCGRDDPQAASGPDFDTLMGQLEEERIQRRAQRYLRDLRNDAYIEYN